MRHFGLSTLLTLELRKTSQRTPRAAQPARRHPPAKAPARPMPLTPSQRRRINLEGLLEQHLQEQLAEGVQTGGATSFAERIGVHKSLLSKLKGDEQSAGSRNISDTLAAQIEARLGLPSGWLDVEHDPDATSQAEQAFLAQALAAYRATNAQGRRDLKRLVAGFTRPPEAPRGE